MLYSQKAVKVLHIIFLYILGRNRKKNISHINENYLSVALLENCILLRELPGITLSPLEFSVTGLFEELLSLLFQIEEILLGTSFCEFDFLTEKLLEDKEDKLFVLAVRLPTAAALAMLLPLGLRLSSLIKNIY